MGLKRELLENLNNDNEPLKKRIKLAYNAFLRTELPIQQRETILMKWIVDINRDDDLVLWQECLKWIKSDTFTSLQKTDVNSDDLQQLLEMLFNELLKSKHDIKLPILIALIETNLFQSHIKLNVEFCCNYLVTALKFANTEEELLTLLNNDKFLTVVVRNDANFNRKFAELCLMDYLALAKTHYENRQIYDLIVQTLQRATFSSRHADIVEYLNEMVKGECMDNSPVEFLWRILKEIYDTEEYAFNYNILFSILHRSLKKTSSIHKFLVTIAALFGFEGAMNINIPYKIERKNFSKSLHILNNLFEMYKADMELKEMVGDVSFAFCLERLANQVVFLSLTSNRETFRFINFSIEMIPMFMNRECTMLLQYFIFHNHDETSTFYTQTFNELIKLVCKLHHFPNFLGKLLTVLTDAYLKEKRMFRGGFTFDGDSDASDETLKVECRAEKLLPRGVLDCFGENVALAVTKTCLTMYTNLITEFKELMNLELEDIVQDDKKICYLYILTMLKYELQMNVRIADYTVPPKTLTKFLAALHHHSLALGDLGRNLLKIKHNMKVMRAFLNSCFAWGEIKIFISYYSIAARNHCKSELDGNNEASNMCYLHNYLTTDEWCLINERIRNFGKISCKSIMEKLWIQKLQAISLFEVQLPSEISQEVIKSIMNSSEYLKFLLTDKYSFSLILPKLDVDDYVNLAEYLINNDNVMKKYNTLKNDIDCGTFSHLIFYVCLRNIDKVLSNDEFVSTKMFKQLKADDFYNENVETIEMMVKIFEEKVAIYDNVDDLSIDEDEILMYLDIIETLPLLYLDNYAKEMIFICLATLLNDLRGNVNISEKIKKLLFALIEGETMNLINSIDSKSVMIYFIKHFANYTSILAHILNALPNDEENVAKLKPFVKHVKLHITEDAYTECAFLLLKSLNISIKGKCTLQLRNMLADYKLSLIKSAIEHFDQIKSLNLIAHLAIHGLDKDDAEIISKCNDFVNNTIFNEEETFDVNTNLLLLFYAILKHKSRYVKELSDKVVLKMWKYIIHQNVRNNYHQDYRRCVGFLIENLPFQLFTVFIRIAEKDLKGAIRSKNIENIRSILHVWIIILRSFIDQTKCDYIKQSVEAALIDLFVLIEAPEENLRFLNELKTFLLAIFKNPKLPLNSVMMDNILSLPTALLKMKTDFNEPFSISISIYIQLLQDCRESVYNRLPVFLQGCRALLQALCKNSDDTITKTQHQIDTLIDYSFTFNRLISRLLPFEEQFATIAVYLIADILHEYETHTIIEPVKMNLNNCLYMLIDITKEYGINYLLRILSPASNELFKSTHEYYEKNIKFTGKV